MFYKKHYVINVIKKLKNKEKLLCMLKNVLIKKNNLNGQIYMKIYLRRIFLRNLQMKILKHLMELIVVNVKYLL